MIRRSITKTAKFVTIDNVPVRVTATLIAKYTPKEHHREELNKLLEQSEYHTELSMDLLQVDNSKYQETDGILTNITIDKAKLKTDILKEYVGFVIAPTFLPVLAGPVFYLPKWYVEKRRKEYDGDFTIESITKIQTEVCTKVIIGYAALIAFTTTFCTDWDFIEKMRSTVGDLPTAFAMSILFGLVGFGSWCAHYTLEHHKE